MLKLVSSYKTVVVRTETSSSISKYRIATGRRDRMEVDATFDVASDIVKQAKVGDHFEVCVDVGGSGCEVNVADFTCTAVVAMEEKGERGVPQTRGLDIEKPGRKTPRTSSC